MKINGETKCPKCNDGTLWVRRTWEGLGTDHLKGLGGFVKCSNYGCSYQEDYKEEDWDIKLRKY